MAFKKIDREFCLTDDSVNVYGYRLLTSGLQLDRFTPSIGFLMHDREKGVAVRWEDFRIEEGRLYAKPVVNESKFPGLAQEIEDGFYSAASVGHIVALEYSDEPKYKLEGQTGVTVTKWFPRECSIVDIPGNYNALARLYDENDTLLHDLTDKTEKSMETNGIKVEDLQLPNLKADATMEQVTAVINDLKAKAERAETAEKQLAELKASMNKDKVNALLEKGKAERRLTQELADKLGRDYADSPEALEELIGAMPVQAVASEHTEDVPEELKGKTYRDLYMSGELEEAAKKYPDYVKSLKEQN